MAKRHFRVYQKLAANVLLSVQCARAYSRKVRFYTAAVTVIKLHTFFCKDDIPREKERVRGQHMSRLR